MLRTLILIALAAQATLATAQTRATIATPLPGSTFTDSGVVFSWAAVNGASKYYLRVGNSLGSTTYGSIYTTGTSLTVRNLPLDGRTIYVRLYTFYGSTSYYNDFTYRAATGPTTAQISSPRPGSMLTGSSVVFTWNNITGATRYHLEVGNSLGSASFASIYATDLSVTARNLPVDGRTLYVRLTTFFGSLTYTADYNYQAYSPNAPPPSGGLRFVPVTPCRIADTRIGYGTFGGPTMTAGSTRDFPVPSSACGIPFGAKAYSLNVTVVPGGPLSYITLYPSGQARPLVSTLNSFDGRIKANAAIIPANASGAISAFATDRTDLILDINGYFVSPTQNAQALAFYPVAPCRVSDTRDFAGTLGGPAMYGGETRNIPVAFSNCGIPATARAYAVTATVYPMEPLAYLTLWPTGNEKPLVSTLNAFTGTVVANAAIVPAGFNGSISAFVTNRTDLTIDITGYFAPAQVNDGLSFYTLNPCRILDTRNAPGPFGGPSLQGGQSRTYTVTASGCNVPTAARAYTVNATVVPLAPLPGLTLWAAGDVQPNTPALAAYDLMVTSNAAFLGASYNGSIAAAADGATEFLLDINGYFAP